MAAAYGLYTHIQHNRVRSVVLIAGLFFLVYILVFAFVLGFLGFVAGDEAFGDIMDMAWWDFLYLAPWATVATAVWVFFGYSMHQRLIDAATGAKGVTRTEEPRLYNILENLCISRGIPTPKLQIIETDVMNAYASGMHDGQYQIAVTRGLMNALNDQELEAVLGHELTHIRNGDVRLMVVAVVIAGVITLVGEFVFRVLLQGPRIRTSGGGGSSKKGGGGGAIIIAIVLIAIAWFLSLVIRFALSRSREYLADAGSVELTKNPDAMISALRKIEGHAEMPHVPSGIMEMCIENQKNGVADLFSTHPSVDARVEKLVEVAGGHDPGPISSSQPPSAPEVGTGNDDSDDVEEKAEPHEQGPWDKAG
ncbi:MAG: M48 family metalloprotease [Alphaproteobacteria bacterium]|nr:M48 family metalloprotease [Alphaproteobacteria bacterium]